MATSLTNYAEELLLKLALGTAAGSAPSLWMALGLWEGGTYGPWTETGTGGTEIGTGLGYARVPLDATAWEATVSETALISGTPAGVTIGRVYSRNINPIVFGPSTAAWSTQEIRYGALFDAATGGNCWATLDLGGPFGAVPVGKLLAFPAHAIKVTLSDTFYTDTFTPTARYAVGGFTRQIKEHLLKHMLGQATYLSGPRWFALGTPDWVTNHNGGFTSEVAVGSYARVSAGTWGAPVQDGSSRAIIQLTANVNFPVATANWGAFKSLALVDAASGAANLIAGFNFTGYSPGILSGERLVIRPADLIPRLVT